MDEESAIIGVVVVFLVLLSPILLYWTVAFLDTSGIDRHLPGTLFIAVSALVPVLIVSLHSFLVMRHYNRPRDWIKEKLTFMAVFLFVALFMLLSIMGAV
ncbi:hypothetical protein APY94_07240 [Thermococcus celericrescens]|uniref:Uncharacterized protein n=1 Tax=Thermococcus celericrescens TaxID=227598 RepID=A0A100XXI3_9EURY|nr:hypothetical protein [Thermococcus celericrescens]KUH33056.1 hypothetical protein APY94_07240 [Thermococcus celericrescens]